VTARDPDLGGDPVCWLDRVCPECGLFLDDQVLENAAGQCPRCGHPRDTGHADPLPSPQ